MYVLIKFRLTNVIVKQGYIFDMLYECGIVIGRYKRALLILRDCFILS